MKQCWTIGFLFLIPFTSLTQPEVENMSRQNHIFLAHDFFFTLSLNFEKDFIISEKIRLGIPCGLGRDCGNLSYNGIIGATILAGTHKHFFEGQIGYQHPFYYSDSGPDPPKSAITAGYRLMTYQRVLFKVYGEFIPAVFPDPESYGSLPFLGFALGKSI